MSHRASTLASAPEQVFKQVGAAPAGADDADAAARLLERHIDHGGRLRGRSIVGGRLGMQLRHARAEGCGCANAQKIPAGGLAQPDRTVRFS